MLRFILTRISLVIPTFVGMTLLAFFLIRMVPGDPIETLAGERGIDPARHAALVHEYGLDRPVLVQYAIYVGRLLHGDLGKSMITQEPVLREFAALFPATIELALCAIVFALLIGIPAGMLAAVRRNSVLDHGVMVGSLTGYSMPIFWWGLLLILLFSVQLGWTPVSGRISVQYFFEPVTGFHLVDAWLSSEPGALRSAASHLILPTIVLGTNPLAIIARMTRSAMLEVLGEDYIRTARSKGLPNATVLMRHALRNAAVPIVTVIGIGIALLIGGVVVTESVYAIPGLGRLTVDAVLARDFPTIQGVILLFSFVYVAINLLVDLSYVFFDPRIRY